MASIIKRKGGVKALQWYDGNKRRKTIGLGKMSMKQADQVATHIERLESAKAAGTTVERDTARWVGGIADTLHTKIAKHGLVQAREAATSPTIDELYEAFKKAIPGRSPRTYRNWRQSFDRLVGYFGTARTARSITETQADDWYATMVDKYADSTYRKHVANIKTVWNWGLKREMVDGNPFSHIASSSVAGKTKHFVERSTIDAVIAHCPDAEWRLIFALGRYAGMRPCEFAALRIQDVNWEKPPTIALDSPKTGMRRMPVFAELAPYLLDAAEAAEIGQEFFITLDPDLRSTDTGRRDRAEARLRRQAGRIIRKAGLEPWPQGFVSLRKSRRTELGYLFPDHEINGWLGHSSETAQTHYLMSRPESWEKAAGIEAESGALPQALPSASSDTDPQPSEDSMDYGSDDEIAITRHGRSRSIPPAGFEPALERF